MTLSNIFLVSFQWLINGSMSLDRSSEDPVLGSERHCDVKSYKVYSVLLTYLFSIFHLYYV